MRRALIVLGVLVLVMLVVAGAFAGSVAWADRTAVATTSGDRTGMRVNGTVTIARDERGIPHVRATTDHDLFYGEGYAVGEDRLFQLDLLRRYTTGHLAEVLGAPVAESDIAMRRWDVAGFARRAYDAAEPEERIMLDAFAEGINAAAEREPTPVEFRALAYGFEPWKPTDAIACAMATVFDLVDDPAAIRLRDGLVHELGAAGLDAFTPYSDPKYDAPTAGRGSVAAPLPAIPPPHGEAAKVAIIESREGLGSNAWAVGGARTDDGRAVVANDPHLRTAIPGVWWLFEGRSPHLHIAGATLTGVPGIVLGHNEHVAWGVTNGGTLAMRVYHERMRGDGEVFEDGRWVPLQHRDEPVTVRLGGTRATTVPFSPRGFVERRDGDVATVVAWPFLDHPHSLLAAFSGLERASSVDDANAALHAYEAPVQNFVFAGDDGRAGYRLGGLVVADAVGARTSAPGDAATPPPAVVPFEAMPHVAPARDAIVWTANNAMVGIGAPFRLAAWFSAPYRAWEIHRRLDDALHAHGGRMSADDIAAIQADVVSPAERELADAAVAAVDRRNKRDDPGLAKVASVLRGFDGSIASQSTAASAAVALRLAAGRRLASLHLSHDLATDWLANGPVGSTVVRAVRERPRGWFAADDADAFLIESLRDAQTMLGGEPHAFGRWFAVPLKHPLANLGFSFMNGPTIVGHGGALAPAVQGRTAGQSFRAVWIAGDWDHSTIDIPAGESGEPASPHYADLTARWNRFERTPLPFSDSAVTAATRATLQLRP